VSVDDGVSHYVYILKYTIRLIVLPTIEVNIHNQCPGLVLTYVKHYGDGVFWHKGTDRRADTSNIASVKFILLRTMFRGSVIYRLFQGAVIYRLQKVVKSDEQPEPTHTLLFFAWKSEGYKKFCVFAQLIECDATFYWYKIRPEEYYQIYASQLCTYTGPIKNTWLTHDGTVFMTELKLDFMQRDGRLDLIVSEGISDDHTKRPVWFGSER
jgi:hypothetical protein